MSGGGLEGGGRGATGGSGPRAAHLMRSATGLSESAVASLGSAALFQNRLRRSISYDCNFGLASFFFMTGKISTT